MESMNRRQHLVTLLGTGLLGKPLAGASHTKPIHLHLDLHVDAGREEEMVRNYREIFRPTIRKQPGFVDVKLLKRRGSKDTPVPAESKYLLIISFESEELRTQWTSTDEHQSAWPTIGNTLTGSRYTARHYDEL